MERKVLPDTVYPINYDLHITTEPDTLTYTGWESIDVQITQPTNQLFINSCDIKIVYAKVFINNNFIDALIEYDVKEEKAILKFPQTIEPSIIKLEISFTGTLKTNMNGFYVSNYTIKDKKSILLSTHFEPTAARQAFPCFDQPDMKATFNIKITHSKELTCISNMSVKTEEINENFKTVIFNQTPKMSTYLVAFAIGNLEFIETESKNGVKIRVYIPKGYNIESGRFSLNVCSECLTFFESYFSIKYPMDKLDMLAVPEFSMGAMENWGLITYRMSSLLYDENNSAIQTKKRVAETVCHELAHQWFGNLVTMKWWNDLWLNEGFATWAAALGVSNLSRELIDWDVWTSFISEDVEAGMSYDSLQSTHAVEVPVYDPNDINQIFDGISYSKGASLIRMLENYVGQENFRNGLKEYLNKFQYRNAITDDLWLSLSNNVEGVSEVKKLMDQWTAKEGFPYISVEMVDENHLSLKQERFYLNNVNIKEKNQSHWFIPVRIGFQNEENILVEMKNKKEILVESDFKKYFKVNYGAYGFYRVLYKGDLLYKIQGMLEEKMLEPRDRLNIINDFFSLTMANYFQINDFLLFVRYFKDEENYEVLSSILGGLNELKSIFYKNEIKKEFFRNKILELVSRRAIKIDLAKPGTSLNEISLNALLISSSVGNEDSNILKKFVEIFPKFKKDRSLVSPVFRTSMFNSLMKMKPKEFYEEIFDIYTTSTVIDEKLMALSSLGSSSDLNYFLTFLSESMKNKVNLQDKIYVYFSCIANLKYRDSVIKFVMENFDGILQMFEGNTSMVSYVVERVFGILSEESELKELGNFFSKRNLKGYERSFMKVMERIEIRSTFRKNVENINLE
ncbi:M1 peptidase [Hamiltosporidium magnivora]|uniref:Aminopeptidase n=2 Tax=Hamiltosporidium magnivora TaxID=148818 RepID=A0A4Q9L6W9_9MICR|nr:M1 peptidase [Hamiltosporidium magnivora]